MAGSGERVSYAALSAAAKKGAAMFRAAGLRTGDGIAVFAENRVESLQIFWAAQLAGLYYTAISVQFLADEVGYILADCDAKALVTTTTQLARLPALAVPQSIRYLVDGASPGSSSWHAALADFSDALIDDACEGAEMLYSSGTTGHPKGVRNASPGAPLGTVSELFHRRVGLHRLDRDSVYLSTAPLYHSAPLRYSAMIARLGGTSVIMQRFEAEAALSLIDHYHVTHSQWVPTMFVRLLRLPKAVRDRYDLSSHRYAIHAAAPCPVPVKRSMLDWWGPIVYEYYSGTEGNGQTAIAPDEWIAHPGSVGRAILGRVHIVGAHGREVATGETGTIYFAGGPQFEYYKDPAKTAASRTADGWSTLGDIGHVDEQGYLYLTDRASHMIISGGVNVYPQEVENVLLSHPQVADAAVFGVPDEEFGERVHAAVELHLPGDSDDSLAAGLIGFCRARLANLKCPQTIEFHTKLPRHDTGKLYKRLLQNRE